MAFYKISWYFSKIATPTQFELLSSFYSINTSAARVWNVRVRNKRHGNIMNIYPNNSIHLIATRKHSFSLNLALSRTAVKKTGEKKREQTQTNVTGSSLVVKIRGNVCLESQTNILFGFIVIVIQALKNKMFIILST